MLQNTASSMRVDSQDPFNYPSLNRKDLMSLSTLNTK